MHAVACSVVRRRIAGVFGADHVIVAGRGVVIAYAVAGGEIAAFRAVAVLTVVTDRRGTDARATLARIRLSAEVAVVAGGTIALRRVGARACAGVARPHVVALIGG